MKSSKKGEKNGDPKKTSKKGEKKEKDPNNIYEYYNIIPPKTMLETDDQRELVKKFQEHPDIQKYKDRIPNDDYCVRWLISRQWDLEKSVEMYCNSQKYKEDNDLENIIDSYPDDPLYQKIKDFWPGSATGEFYTKDGWPVYYERIGIVDPKYLFNQIATKEQLTRYHCYEQETRERIRHELHDKHGYTIGAIFVQDLNGLGWKHLTKETMDCLKLVSFVDQNNFPESVRKMYIINAPSMFTAIWKLIKPMIDKRTITKLSIMGSGYEEELRALIPLEELPVWAGGMNDRVAMPVNFHKQVNNDEEGDDNMFLTKLKIPAREKTTILIKIRTKNTTIGWKFFLKSNDIGFYITYKKNSKAEEKTVLENTKYEKHQGTYVAKHRGFYYIIFDNTYSWTKKKTVRYQTYTQKPESFDVDSPVNNNTGDANNNEENNNNNEDNNNAKEEDS
jgi:hypothetical protein